MVAQGCRQELSVFLFCHLLWVVVLWCLKVKRGCQSPPITPSLYKTARGKGWTVKWALCLCHLIQESGFPQLPFTSPWSALGHMPPLGRLLAGGNVVG